MRFAICQEVFENWEWEEQCRAIARIGYTGIEVAPFTLAPRITDVSAEQRKILRSQAEGHGLSILGLHWLLAKTEGFHLTSTDTTVRKNTSQYLIELVHACADLGGNVLVFGSPFQRNLDEGVSFEEGMERAEKVFRPILSALDDRQVNLCFEPLTPAETNFVTTCGDGVRLIERINHPRFILHQDVKAMLSEPTPIPELIHRHARYCGHFHANDSNKLGPGMGETDFTPIFRALKETNYQGWVSVEVFDYRPGAEHIAEVSLRYMQEVWQRVNAG